MGGWHRIYFFIAFLGFLLAKIPGFSHVGQLACAIIIAVAFRQFFGYPEVLRSGITFSTKKLLRLAIILYGLRLNMAIVFQDGLGLLVRDAFVIAFAILTTIWLAKLLKADKMISLLVGVGTGVCGAAAIAAIAPIVKAKMKIQRLSRNDCLDGNDFRDHLYNIKAHFTAPSYRVWHLVRNQLT
ncbi:putative sulfate exporter family transporter [Bacillus sp. N9]